MVLPLFMRQIASDRGIALQGQPMPPPRPTVLPAAPPPSPAAPTAAETKSEVSSDLTIAIIQTAPTAKVPRAKPTASSRIRRLPAAVHPVPAPKPPKASALRHVRLAAVPQSAPPSAAGILRTSNGHPATEEQIAINDAATELAAAGQGALKLIAFAGTGKTSTLSLLASNAFKSHQGTYLAFNKTIADAAKAAMPTNVSPRTFHSFAGEGTGIRFPKGQKNLTSHLVGQIAGDIWLPAKEADASAAAQKRWLADGLRHFVTSGDPTPGRASIEAVLDEIRVRSRYM